MKYKVKVGLNYPTKNGTVKRVEAGQIASDIPEESTKWLLEQGLIEAVGSAAVNPPAAPAPVSNDAEVKES